MKKIFLLVAAIALALGISAQNKGTVGSKGAEMNAAQWVGDKPTDNTRPMLIEFYLSSAKGADQRRASIGSIADQYGTKLNIVIVSRQSADELATLTSGDKRCFVALDSDGVIFADYGVKFVPYTVLVNRKGRIAWVGNPNINQGKELQKAIELCLETK